MDKKKVLKIVMLILLVFLIIPVTFGVGEILFKLPFYNEGFRIGFIVSWVLLAFVLFVFTLKKLLDFIIK